MTGEIGKIGGQEDRGNREDWRIGGQGNRRIRRSEQRYQAIKKAGKQEKKESKTVGKQEKKESKTAGKQEKKQEKKEGKRAGKWESGKVGK